MPRKEFEKIRKDSHFLKRYGNAISSSAQERTLELKKTNATLKSLVKQKKIGGDRLAKAGAVLLLVPDPVTGVASVPFLLASHALKTRSSKKSDLERVFESAKSDLNSLFSSASSF
ncbi:MAG: hypothetical protein ACYCQJ_11950 [Nitrososphaerales archaeon]